VLLTSACLAHQQETPSSSIATPEASRSASPPELPPTPTPRASTPESSATRKPTRAEDFHPANFHHPTDITNVYFPMVPGTTLRWEGHAYDDGQKVSRAIESTVTGLTKEIAGVQTVVGLDRDFTDGKAEEVELTFYAQDDDGTVWYFGEYSEEYDDAEIVKSPLWLAGLQGATAGVMMQAAPGTGQPDYAEGLGPAVGWNDRAKVDRVGVRDCVRTGCYDDVVVIAEFNVDEPGLAQLKSYARGVGGIRTAYRGAEDTEREQLQLVARHELTAAQLKDVEDDARDEEDRAYQRSPRVYGKTARMKS
jgi:hypothetical protein